MAESMGQFTIVWGIFQSIEWNHTLKAESMEPFARFVASDNGLTGTIPSTLSQWSNLREFDALRSVLKGTIPSSLSQWSNLQKFDVYLYSLTGSIPWTLSQ